MPIYTMTKEEADAVVAKTGTLFKGRGVSREGETQIHYSGSRADQRSFEEIVASVKKVPAPAASAELATPRQIAYLRNLLRTENGQLSGVSVSDWDSLTKEDASRAINIILGWA